MYFNFALKIKFFNLSIWCNYYKDLSQTLIESCSKGTTWIVGHIRGWKNIAQELNECPFYWSSMLIPLAGLGVPWLQSSASFVSLAFASWLLQMNNNSLSYIHSFFHFPSASSSQGISRHFQANWERNYSTCPGSGPRVSIYWDIALSFSFSCPC